MDTLCARHGQALARDSILRELMPDVDIPLASWTTLASCCLSQRAPRFREMIEHFQQSPGLSLVEEEQRRDPRAMLSWHLAQVSSLLAEVCPSDAVAASCQKALKRFVRRLEKDASTIEGRVDAHRNEVALQVKRVLVAEVASFGHSFRSNDDAYLAASRVVYLLNIEWPKTRPFPRDSEGLRIEAQRLRMAERRLAGRTG